MTKRKQMLAGALVLNLLAALSGCTTLSSEVESGSSTGSILGGNGTSALAPPMAGQSMDVVEPPAGRAATRKKEGGLLLRTGSILLGPGVCRNLWRWQGDGLWGF
jgi:hypothetical protein